MFESAKKLNEIIKREKLKQAAKNPEIASLLKLNGETVTASPEGGNTE